MKKIALIILLIIIVGGIVFAIIKVNNKSFELVSKNEGKISDDKVIEITDNYFIEQTNDIYLNMNDYIGKKVRFEGLVYTYKDTDEKIFYAVVRNTPGCCGNDGLAGLDIRYEKKYPKEGTWVEVEGIIEEEEQSGEKIPVVKVSSIKEKEEGTTFVTN